MKIKLNYKNQGKYIYKYQRIFWLMLFIVKKIYCKILKILNNINF